MPIGLNNPKTAITLSVLALAFMFVEQFERWGWLSACVPWLPLALAVGAVAILLRARPYRPAALAASILVLAGSLALVPTRGNRDGWLNPKWRRAESGVIVTTLGAVGNRVQRLQALSTSIGEEAAGLVEERSAAGDSVVGRLAWFRFLEDVADRIERNRELPPGTQVGLQVFDAGGRRVAWAGWPQPLYPQDKNFVGGDKALTYSQQVSLYQILRHMIPLKDHHGQRGAALLIDMPLEVNYKVNNNFLKSASFVDDISSSSSANLRFDYYPTEYNLQKHIERYGEELSRRRELNEKRLQQRVTPEQKADSILAYAGLPATIRPIGGIHGDEASGLSTRALVHSQLGNPLFTVSVVGPPYSFFVERFDRRLRLVASTLILAALIIYFLLLVHRFPRRLAGPLNVFKAAYIVLFLILLRYWLLWLEPRVTASALKTFDPAIFATPFLGGLMRSAGDLLVTSVFFVVALYAVLKTTRESIRRGEERPPRWLFIVKGVLAALALYGAHELASRFVRTVVVNANPRLLGEAMRLFESHGLVLHVSVFLMISGFFLAAVIAVWGVFLFRGRADRTHASLVTAGLSVVFSLFVWRWDVAIILLLLLLFVVFAPRIVQREDLVSIVGVAFCFVVIVSTAAYAFLNENYQELRRTFIQEKVAELTHPSDNWKVFILEDVLEKLSQDNTIMQTLANPASENMQSLAFDLWAESSLSYLGYSSAIHVFDRRDSLVSGFTVEMPYRLQHAEATERLETATGQEWAVLDLTTDTPNGIVRFYRGIVNIGGFLTPTAEAPARSLGKVVVDIPFFFESLSWAARTGPQTPEVLRNVQEGGIAPRLEETEALLLARLQGNHVLETSSDVLPVGFAFGQTQLDAAKALQWPILTTSGESYRYLVIDTDEAGSLLLAGFPVPRPVQHMLRWSTILSLYFFFTVGILVVIIVLRSLPAFGRVLPSLTPGRQLGFQQKILASFLLIALLPSVILGVFSVRLIRDRFIQENRNEALNKSLSAQKSLSNQLVSELNYVLDHSDLRDLTSGETPPFFERDPKRRIVVVSTTREGHAVDSLATRESTATREEVWQLVGRFAPGTVFAHWWRGKPFLAVLSRPFNVLMDGEQRTFTLFYERLLDNALLADVADQVGADVNVYHGGDLFASSREGLLFGGFISATMNADAFVKVSLMGVDRSVASENAGNYRYEVAYVPLPTSVAGENGAIGVPLLFQPESFHIEVQKATSVVFGVFALLSAVTIGIGLLLARGIFEPLKGLLEGTRRISRGDLAFRLRSTRRDEIGTVVEAFNEMTDQLSRSHATLEERRRYLEVILASIGTGVISTDSDNNIRAVNKAAETILGIDGATITGRAAGELARSGVAPDFFGALADGNASEESFVSSEINVTREGRSHTIRYMQTRLTTEGGYMGTVLVFEDLTELINTKKLSAWVEMARQIAHEIKNPLTPIKLSTQFMVKAHEERARDFDDIFKESAGTIIQQVEILRRIASEFSSFGRMQEIDVAPQDIVPEIEKIVAPYKRNASGVEITFDWGDLSLKAVSNGEALRKICTNLIENAMEAMPEGGRLDITCGTGALNGRELVMVSFRDNGPGLNEDIKQKLFEPYFSTKTTGTGLGLAICRRLSREMGGDVVLKNLSEGRGVEALLYLKPA